MGCPCWGYLWGKIGLRTAFLIFVCSTINYGSVMFKSSFPTSFRLLPFTLGHKNVGCFSYVQWSSAIAFPSSKSYHQPPHTQKLSLIIHFFCYQLYACIQPLADTLVIFWVLVIFPFFTYLFRNHLYHEYFLKNGVIHCYLDAKSYHDIMSRKWVVTVYWVTLLSTHFKWNFK